MGKQISAAIKNANIVLENGIIWDGVILLSEDRIAAAGRARELDIPQSALLIDAGGSYVGPGLVDIHVHGGNECSTCFEAEKAAEYFLSHGATSMLSTPSYDMNFDELMEAIRAAKAAMKNAKTIKGLYIEGPYTNPKYGSNAYKNPWRDAINSEQFKQFVDEAGDAATVWTIAPEREGIMPFLEYARCVNPDTVFAIGHSEATPAQIRALGKFCPTIQTHSMCATGRLPVYGGTRAFGPDEYCFKEPDIYCELISDSCGIHVNAEMQQLLLHNKGIHRVILITDSTVYHNPNPAHLAHVNDLNFDERGGIAGSRLTMDVACKNIMTHTNCGIAQAFIMASLNPARAIGLGDELGSIEADKKADLIFVDDKFNIKQVMTNGKMCDF